MKSLKLLTLFCILSGLMISGAAAQNRRQKPNKKRPSKVSRKIIVGPPLIFEATVPHEKPYFTKAEAACPQLCAFLTTLSSGIEIEPKAGVYELRNRQRLEIKLLLKEARVEDQEYLSLESDRRGPNPEEPTVTMSVRKIEDGRMVDVPVKISSSGGRSVTVLSLRISLKIPYPDEVRKKRAKSWAEDMIRFLEEEIAKEAKPRPYWRPDPDMLANYMSEVAVDNQAGEYELRFRYKPHRTDVRNKPLELEPLKIRVVDEGNPFAHLLTKDSDKHKAPE